MKREMYERLVGVIHRHRTWIGVAEWEKAGEAVAVVNSEPRRAACRTLVLFSREKRGAYPKGYSWNIPERSLDKAAIALRQRDPAFKARWKAGRISPEDAEFIIGHASHWLLSLNLKSLKQLADERNSQPG